MMDELLGQIPEHLRPRFREVVALTDSFCAAHLDDEYRDLCREMTALLCREGFPVTSGKPAGWAAGVVYSLAWVNFLGDPSQPHHMKAEDMARALGVSPATLMAKAKIIREGLDLDRMDPRWSVRSVLERNPLVWMVEDQHGLLHDLRRAPRAVQEEALRLGLIPFLPPEATRDQDAGEEGR